MIDTNFTKPDLDQIEKDGKNVDSRNILIICEYSVATFFNVHLLYGIDFGMFLVLRFSGVKLYIGNIDFRVSILRQISSMLLRVIIFKDATIVGNSTV